MELDEPRDGLDVVGRVAQCLHALTRHARPHHLVMMERHEPARERTRLGLAHVVEQRSEAHDAKAVARSLRGHVLDDGDGVREDVFVPVDRVLFEPHRRKLGKELVGELRVDEQPQTLARLVDDHELVELVSDALRRDDLHPAPQLGHRLDQPVNGFEVISGNEPRRRGSMRSGSSVNDSDGESGVRRRDAARSTAPSNGSTSFGSGRASAIAFTVKSRRERSASIASEKATSGLRESGW